MGGIMVTALHEIQVIMAVVLFVIGLLTFWMGAYLLVFKAAGHDVRTLATQTTRLVQKGLSEEIAGLVGNATILLNTVNDMARTTAGIGVFLSLTGLMLMVSAIWLISSIQ
jgi:hypothetical protein